MFGTALIAVITLLHIDVFWRAASVPFLRRRVPQKLLIGVSLLLWAGFFFGRILGHGGTARFASSLELYGMSWMGVLFLLFVCLLAMDLITGFGFVLPRLAPSLRGWSLITGGLLSAIALVQGLRPPVVQNHDVCLGGLPDQMDGKVMVVAPDLHLGSLLDEQWLEARVTQIQGQKPDLVVLLGDLFEGHGLPQDEALPTLRSISAPFAEWVVPGNHEFHGRDGTSTYLIEGAGFRLLRNCWAELLPGLVLAGVDDLTTRLRSGESSDYISKALSGRPPGAAILLPYTLGSR